jgi:hypothetical protein
VRLAEITEKNRQREREKKQRQRERQKSNENNDPSPGDSAIARKEYYAEEECEDCDKPEDFWYRGES